MKKFIEILEEIKQTGEAIRAAWGDYDIIAEIAHLVGCLPDDVELFKFQGYSKTPIYGRA